MQKPCAIFQHALGIVVCYDQTKCWDNFCKIYRCLMISVFHKFSQVAAIFIQTDSKSSSFMKIHPVFIFVVVANKQPHKITHPQAKKTLLPTFNQQEMIKYRVVS